jgi:hypothetical protein
MALQNERDELLAAWRALGGEFAAEGWRTIPVGLGGPCRLMAGRHFPGNEEALLVAFQSEWMPPVDQLPQGHGFHVSRAQLSDAPSADSWIALCRQSAGRLDLFAMMAVDIIGTLASLAVGDTRIVPTFLGRIKAWQEFMRIGASGLLGAEAETGLFGELEFMGALIRSGLSASIAVDAWRGPLGGVHDFVFGTGGIEVKSTVVQVGFPATINSLEQLDDSIVRPLFLGAVRLALEQGGKPLPVIVSELRQSLASDVGALARFDSCLLHSGYLDSMAEKYSRSFRSVQISVFPVSEVFPRLTRRNVPLAVRSACYEVDLDLAILESVTQIEALRQLGVR